MYRNEIRHPSVTEMKLYAVTECAHTHTARAHTRTHARSHSPQYHDFVVSPRRVFSSRGISFDVVVIIIIISPRRARHGAHTHTRAHTHRIMSLDSDTHRRRCRRPVGRRRDLCMCVEGLCRPRIDTYLFERLFIIIIIIIIGGL